MTLSRLELVLQGVEARLKDGIAGAVDKLQIVREDNSSIDHFPTLVILDDGGRPQERLEEHAEYRATVAIEGYVSYAKPKEAAAALTELYAQTVKALFADETLGGVALQIFEGDRAVDRVSKEPGVKPHMVFTLRIEVQFFTAPDDPFTAA